MTGRTGVFAGGDAAAMGPWTAVEAIAAGRRGARAIHNFLRGEQLVPVWDRGGSTRSKIPQERARSVRAAGAPHHEDAGRGGRGARTWEEVRLGFSEEEARAEAERCLTAPCAPTASRASPPARPTRSTSSQQAVGRGDHRRRRDSGDRPPGVRRRGASCRSATAGKERHHPESACSPALGLQGRPEASWCVRRTAPRPKRIFMLQCVGSRDCTSSGNEHCSAICCLFATLHSLPDQAARPRRGDHHRLHRPARAGQGTRGVLPPCAGARRALRARPRRRECSRSRTVAHRAPGEHDDRVERVRSGTTSSCSPPASRPPRALEDIARVAGVQTAAGPASSASSTPSCAPSTRSAAGMPCRHRPGARVDPGFDRAGQGGGGPCHQHAELRASPMTPAQVAASDVAVCVGCGVCETTCPRRRRSPSPPAPVGLHLQSANRKIVGGGRHRRCTTGGDGSSVVQRRRSRRSAVDLRSPATSHCTIVALCCCECAAAGRRRRRQCRDAAAWSARRLALGSMPGRPSAAPQLGSGLPETADAMVAGLSWPAMPLPVGHFSNGSHPCGFRFRPPRRG